MFDDVFVWMGKISGTGDDDKNKPLIYSCHALIIGIAKPGQLPLPIIAPVSTSYLDFQELLNPAHN